MTIEVNGVLSNESIEDLQRAVLALQTGGVEVLGPFSVTSAELAATKTVSIPD